MYINSHELLPDDSCIEYVYLNPVFYTKVAFLHKTFTVIHVNSSDHVNITSTLSFRPNIVVLSGVNL